MLCMKAIISSRTMFEVAMIGGVLVSTIPTLFMKVERRSDEGLI